MGNGKEDQAPGHTFGISSNKYAFYHILAEGCLYFSPFKKPVFQGDLPEQFKITFALQADLVDYVFLFFLRRPMGRPAFSAVYRPVFAGFKRYLAFLSAVTANSLVNGRFLKLFKKMIILKPWPTRFGVPEHVWVVF
jgi:hypothetical protein